MHDSTKEIRRNCELQPTGETPLGGRIIYYGADESRLRTLLSAGYSVQNCNSLSEFRWILYSGGRADVVAFTEAVGKAPQTVMSLARNGRSPLVLFQCRTPHYDESEFNLVVPILTSAKQWLGDIASLIGNTRDAVQRSFELHSKSRLLRKEAAVIIERTRLELHRSNVERERNHGFNVDFLETEGRLPEFVVLPGSSGFLRSLGDDALREFRSMLRLSSCPTGTVLFAEGQMPLSTYLLLRGNVKLSVNSSDGKRFIVRIANPGEILGLASALESCAHQATAETCYPCDVGSVDSSDFLRFLEEHPRALRAAANELSRDYNQACIRLRTMGVSFTVMAKLAGLLLEWSANGTETEQGTQIHMALTHAEVGQCIGAARESVTRVLHDFQQRQFIDQRGSLLTILDRPGLETCAGVR
jgi:CRP/FNR family transcriptional regulator